MSVLTRSFATMLLAAAAGSAHATNGCTPNTPCGGNQQGGTTVQNDNRDTFHGSVSGTNTNSLYSVNGGNRVHFGDGSLSPSSRSSSSSDAYSLSGSESSANNRMQLENVGNGGSSNVNIEGTHIPRFTGSILLGGASGRAHTTAVGLCGRSFDKSFNLLGLLPINNAETLGLDDRKIEGSEQTRGEKCVEDERAYQLQIAKFSAAAGMTQSPDAGLRAAGLASLAQHDEKVQDGLTTIKESVTSQPYKECVAKRGAGAERDPLEMVLGVPTASCDSLKTKADTVTVAAQPPVVSNNNYYVLPNVYIAGKKLDKPCDVVERKLTEAFVCTDGKNKGKVLSEAEVMRFRLDRAQPAPGGQ